MVPYAVAWSIAWTGSSAARALKVSFSMGSASSKAIVKSLGTHPVSEKLKKWVIHPSQNRRTMAEKAKILDPITLRS